jgi:predicted enzyme related to lactoylglutathione lyase
MALTELAIVSVPVADQDRAKAFYADKLGFTVSGERRDMMGPGKHWITLQAGSGATMITLVTWFETMPAGSLRGLVIGTDDVDADYARLKPEGVDIDEVKQEFWGRYATLRDSEGNGLILRSPPKD